MPQGMRSADHSGADGPRASEVCQFTDSTCTQMRVGYPQTPSSSYSCNWVNFSYTHGSASPGEEVPSGGEALAAPTNIHPMSLCISKIFATIAWDKVGGAPGYEINIYEGAEHSEYLFSAPPGGRNHLLFSHPGCKGWRWSDGLL